MRSPFILAIALCTGAAASQAADPVSQGGIFPSVMAAQPAAPSAQPAAQPDAGAAAPAPGAPTPAQLRDYADNLKSDVFGAALFTGSFAGPGSAQFNPDYLVAPGDRIQLRLWGGFNFDNVLPVDPRGNIFLPYVGPLKVAGARNEDLQRIVDSAVRQVFRSNVSSYASLAAAQPVRVFVTGKVGRPGLYNGTSMDSLLHYLDMAGGVDTERGSFLTVQVKRGESVRATVSLYDFLLQGKIPLVQLGDGDVILVGPRQNVVRVSGMAENAKRFEFRGATLSVAELAELAKPLAQVTHVRVVHNTGTVRNVSYYTLAEARALSVANGDEVEFTADKKPGTITVRVEGEHQSAQEYVLPYGSRLGGLISQVQFSERSDVPSIQLFRQSVRERQKAMLQTSMRSLESTILTARSGTSDEARLRKDESELILQWVERAKKIEPSGQVLIGQGGGRDALLLENGDLIKVPTRDGLVLVSGEVLFPNAVAFDAALHVGDYIGRAGGYTQNAENSRVVVAHRDGSFADGASDPALRPGDDVLVLPKVDVKSRQVWKDLTQIIYQIAVSAKVVLGL